MLDGAAVVPELQGTNLIAVVCDATQALAIGAVLARAGAETQVVRSVEAARAALAAQPHGFDGALVDLGLGADAVAVVVELIRAQAMPCFHALLGDPCELGDLRDAFGSGAIEIVTAPLLPAEIAAAAVRVVDATARVRRRCRPVPHAPASASPRPRRRRPEVDHAVDDIADDCRLSPRERSVLRYIGLGFTYAEIGRELTISLSTVKMHAGNLRRKLGASTRGEMLRKMFAV